MTDETETAETKPARPKAMRRWVFWLRAVFVVCLMPFVFLAAAAVMVIDRDITAPSWITERIEARADAVLEGSRLEFGAITVRIGRDLHPTVRLIDTRLVDAGGLTLTRVPLVEGGMSPRGLILRREVLMQNVRLIGAQVNAARWKAGNIPLEAMHNIDMIGWDSDDDGVIEFDSNSDKVTSLYQRSVAGLPVSLLVTTYPNTDHEAYRRQGFTVASISEEFEDGSQNPQYHQPGDTAVELGYFRAAETLMIRVFTALVTPQ